MNQARKDTTGVKLEVNERFVLFLGLYLSKLVKHHILCILYIFSFNSISLSHTESFTAAQT